MDYVAVLQQKRDEVALEIEKLRDEQRTLGESIARKDVQLRNLDELLALEGAGRKEPDSAPASAGPSTTFLDHAADVIKGSGPLYYRDLLKELELRGFEVPGQDPGANLIAHLTRDDRFVRTGRGTYGLKNLHEAAVRGNRRRPNAPRRQRKERA